MKRSSPPRMAGSKYNMITDFQESVETAKEANRKQNCLSDPILGHAGQKKILYTAERKRYALLHR